MLTSILVVSVFLYTTGQNSYSKKDITHISKITVYGIDFSNAVVINESYKHKDMLEGQLYNAINDRFFIEKLDQLRRGLGKEFEINSSLTNKKNSQSTVNYFVIDTNSINKIIKEYELVEKDGIGLVFIVKSLDKPYKKVELYTVFFDIGTKRAIWFKKETGRGGRWTGLENYWCNKVFNAVDGFIDSYGHEFERK